MRDLSAIRTIVAGAARYAFPPLLGALLVLAACAGPDGDHFSGTVQAESASVGSPRGGRVTAVLAQAGRRVRAGQVIVRFDDAQQRAAVAAARHDEAAAAAALADQRAGARPPDLARALAQARQARETYEGARLAEARQIAILRGSLVQAQAQVADARATALVTANDARRARALAATGDESLQQRDAAVARAVSAKAAVASAIAGAANAEDQLRNAAEVTLPRSTASARAAAEAAEGAYRLLAAGARPDVVRQAAADVAAAQSAVTDAVAKLNDTIVRAPADGTISALNLHVGDLIAPNLPIATIDEDGEPFVRVYVPQAKVGRLRVGGHVAVAPDSEPAAIIDGTVEQIDDQAQFTPENVQTAEDRATLSFGVKVRIHDRDHHVRGGTTATVTIS